MQTPTAESSNETSTTPGGLKFPFFDMPEADLSNVSRSYDILQHRGGRASPGLFTPPPSMSKRGVHRNLECSSDASPMMSSEWESEISPIAKNRESDGSDRMIDVEASTRMTPLKTPEKNEECDDIDTMLSELKSIIHHSQKKRKTRSRLSSIGTSSSQSDNDYMVDRLVMVSQTQENEAISSPPSELKTPPSTAAETVENHLEAPLSPACPDLTDARKQVDASSRHFVERIRDAAQKRKMEMTRSRDDLKAMEREQMQAKAASKSLFSDSTKSTVAEVKDEKSSNRHAHPATSNSQFKARPMPATSGVKGMGGLTGVPKVAKKPTTTPFSPLLGSRRPEKIKIKSLEKPKMYKDIEKKSSSANKKRVSDNNHKDEPKSASLSMFKARPVPSFIGRQGQGGLTGVPKVRKRSVTVPKSPMLGIRRNPNVQSAAKEDNDKKNQNLLQKTRQSLLVAQTPSLRGLDYLEATPKPLKDATTIENDENQAPSRKHSPFMPYEPYSTLRAKERANYDSRRDDNMKQKMECDMKNREKEIRRMRRELSVLGEKLS